MDQNSEMATRDKSGEQDRREPEYLLRPAVDIFENEHGITLLADLPGVSNDRLNLQVDKDTLRIAGEAVLGTAQGMEPLWAEVRASRYERTFALSAELDAENISAATKNGVLTVNIPKRAEVRPRKIQVKVA